MSEPTVTVCGPGCAVKHQRIDPLFGDREKDFINWRWIEHHWQDLKGRQLRAR
jgi:hypothetical protein